MDELEMFSQRVWRDTAQESVELTRVFTTGNDMAHNGADAKTIWAFLQMASHFLGEQAIAEKLQGDVGLRKYLMEH